MIVEADLPAPLDLNRFESIENAELHAYGVFSAQVATRQWSIMGREVYIPDRGRCMEPNTAFWHISTDDHGVLARQTSLDRMKRVNWLAPILSAADTGRVNEWKNFRQTRRGPVVNWSLSTGDFCYLVVLRENSYRGALQWLLLTVYPVDEEYRRRQYQAKHARAHEKLP